MGQTVREIETGTAIARAIGGSIVFDAATLASVTAREESSRTSDTAVTAAAAQAKQDPNVCPDPGPDVPHGALERAQRYQELISALNNPQRPLPAGLAVSLINPVTGLPVFFDDCRESDGTMIEAKGPGYAKLLQNAIVADSIAKQWVEQASDQPQASEGRALEWYFAEEKAADEARVIFDKHKDLQGRILIFTVPAEAP